MGRILLVVLLIAAIYLVWKAFGPQSWRRLADDRPDNQPMIKGPDDDENFLWELEKKKFKQRRAQEEARRQEEERIKRAQQRYGSPSQAQGDKKTEKPEPNNPENPGHEAGQQ